MTRISAAWLEWTAISLVVAVLAALATMTLFALAHVEGGVVLFGLGMAYSASTPKVLRWLGRRGR